MRSENGNSRRDTQARAPLSQRNRDRRREIRPRRVAGGKSVQPGGFRRFVSDAQRLVGLGRGRRHRQDAVPPQRKDRRGGERRDIHRSISERPEAQGDLTRSRFRGRRARHRSRHLPPLSDGRGLLSGIFRIHEYLRRRVGHDAG